MINQRPRLLAGITLGALFLAYGCGPRALKQFAAGILQAEKITLYEGLPHPELDAASYKKERGTKPTQTLFGYDFYKEPLALDEKDTKELTAIFSEPANFQSVRAKMCMGSFHPDYGIEWQKGGVRYQALICFGCAEAKFFGPDIGAHEDFQDGIFEKVREILRTHRKNRPLGDGRVQ